MAADSSEPRPFTRVESGDALPFSGHFGGFPFGTSEVMGDVTEEALERFDSLKATTEEEELLAARLRVVLKEHDEQRRRVPNEDGGPGREESYWLRMKLDAAVAHLRDVEDYYRLTPSLHPESFNAVRADRVRQLYEAIIADFREGKMTRPTQAERLLRAEEALRLTILAAQEGNTDLVEVVARAALSPEGEKK